MAELEAITEALRRQRSDLEEMMDSTLTRSGQTAELLGQIADLQRRVEETQRRYEATIEPGRTEGK
jgi:phosphohistidine phosphatase SixA